MRPKLTAVAFSLFLVNVTISNSASSFSSFTNIKIPGISGPIADGLSDETAKGALKRKIRDTHVRTDLSAPLLGKFSPVDVNDSEVKEISVFATTAISASSSAGPFQLVRILKAESQVGIGAVNFKLTLEVHGADETKFRCEVVVFDQSLVKSWTSVCFPIENKPNASSAEELIPSVLAPQQGGYLPIDINEDKVKDIAQFAATALSINLNSGPVTLINIVKAESEGVAGRNYKLILGLEGPDGEAHICEVVVFDQPWTDTRILSNSNCLPMKAKSPPVVVDGEISLSEPRPIDIFSSTNVEDFIPFNKREIAGSSVQTEEKRIPLGGFIPINVNNEQVKEIAEFATSAISNKMNSGPVTLANIVMAEFQTVAGKNYKLTLELKDIQGNRHLCKIVVFDQPWTKTRILSEFNCSPLKTTSQADSVTTEDSQDVLRPATDGFSLFHFGNASNFKSASSPSSSFRLNRSPNVSSTASSSVIDSTDVEVDLGKPKPFKLMKAVTFWARKKKRGEAK